MRARALGLATAAACLLLGGRARAREGRDGAAPPPDAVLLAQATDAAPQEGTAPPGGPPTGESAAPPGAPPAGETPAPPGTVPPETVPPETVPPGTVPPGTAAPGTAAPGTAAPGTAPPATEPGGTPPARSAPPGTAPAPPGASAPASGDRAAADGDADPQARRGGDVEDEGELAARALERSLVQRGALLLPVWGLELVPDLSYQHAGSQTVVRLRTAPEPTPLEAFEARTRTHQLTGQLTLRLGLPWELQVEAAMPAVRASSAVVIGGAARNRSTDWGAGDPRLSVTRQLLRARGRLPDLLVTGTWRAPVADGPFDVDPGQLALGEGSHGVGGTLTASRASDPLVYVASVSYTANLDADTARGRVEPGDTWAAGAGAILALSPAASMSFLADFQYTLGSRLDGNDVLGSDETVALLQLGLAAVISSHTLLNFTVGVGVTEDSPDVVFRVSLPLRF